MKICPKCGYENQDDYKFCERCRYKFGKKKKEVKKDSPLSIVAAALSLFTCTYLLGALIAIVDLAQNDKTKRHLGSGFAIFCAIIYLFIGISDMRDDNNTSPSDVVQTTTELTIEQTTEAQVPTVPTLKEFKEKSEKVSYEDLLRYPETYKDKMIKITVDVNELQAASLSTLFKDAYMCTLDNQTIFCTDYRETQEPSIVKGDKITIYGYGDGQATLTEKEKNALGITTSKDKSYIPSVRIIYAKLK